MTSPHVLTPVLLLPIPLLSFSLALYNRSSPLKGVLLLLLALLAAIASGSALSIPDGNSLRVVSEVFTTLLHTALSGISIYALSQTSLSPSFLVFFLSLAALLIACELVSALIPTSPLILSATLALVSRVILLALTMTISVLLRCRHSPQMNFEKDHESTIGRFSSPIQVTWPFLGLLSQPDKSKRASAPANQPTSSYPNKDARKMSSYNLYLVLATAQLFAILSASLDVVASLLIHGTGTGTRRPLSHVLLASTACTLLWSLAILVVVQMLPSKPRPYFSEKQVATSYGQGPLGGGSNASSHPVQRTPMHSLSTRESDSLLDFLSLRDPFASSPPLPPPLPPVGLGLDEVDVGWSGNKEIGVQYRFPAPRSIVENGRRKGKAVRTNGKNRLLLQNSARTLPPVPETRGTETDWGRDKGFGDEVRLAQLLLQSLGEVEDVDSQNTSAPVPMVTPPQVAHIQPTSRWSTCTTIQSIMSATVSNASGVSTYTTYASDKAPASRISMNTIASVFRKSSETKRKSTMTASSSKG